MMSVYCFNSTKSVYQVTTVTSMSRQAPSLSGVASAWLPGGRPGHGPAAEQAQAAAERPLKGGSSPQVTGTQAGSRLDGIERYEDFFESQTLSCMQSLSASRGKQISRNKLEIIKNVPRNK